MPGTASRARRRQRRIDIAWVAFAAINLGLMVVIPDAQTIPFHNVWVSLSLLYGFSTWRPRTAVLVGVLVALMTGAALTAAVERQHLRADELAEVPMMAAMFGVMVWHVNRRQAAEARVRATAQREREFVRDASHQLRTPITIARGHAELIRSMGRDPQVLEDASVVVDELHRLGRISDGLLLLAAAEHQRLAPHDALDVERFVRSTAERWAVAAPRQWSVDIRAHGTIAADADRLSHAMDALIENAIKVTEPGDLIELAAWADGPTLVLEVRDDGPGVALGDKERIFDRFVSMGNGTGTGLGLAMVRAIAAAHGGSAEVRSFPGHGAAFCMRLPGFVAAPPDTPPSALPVASPRAGT
jgi:signal transduction histidine kinase